MKKIFYNGNFITMDENKPTATAIVVKKNIFEYVGNDEMALKYKDKYTEVINLKGKTVIPGLNDSHMHVLSLGMFLRDVQLDRARSIKDVIEITKDYIDENKIKPGEWVRGRGWNQEKFEDEKRFINRHDLDKISRVHPITFTRTCGHIVSANSMAIEISNLKEEDYDIKGGKVDLDSNGIPLGVFREAARSYIWDAIPYPDVKELKRLILSACTEASKHGITSIHSDDFKDIPKDYQLVIDAYGELVKEEKLNVRIYEQCNLPKIDKLKDFFEKGYYTGWGDEYFKIGPLKLLTDGAFGSKTALLKEPYLNDTNKGIEILDQNELDELICFAHSKDMHVATHSIGDQIMENIIDSIEKAQKQFPKEDMRHGIIHCSLMNENLINKFSQLNIIAYVQPIFLNADIKILENILGKERAKYCYPFKSMINKNIKLSFGSDCPVESLNVMEGIHSAVNRQDLKGFPENGWNNFENISVQDALKGFTLNAAFASFEEDKKGSITMNKLADFVIISEDIYNVDSDKIKDIDILQTYMDGRKVYDQNNKTI